MALHPGPGEPARGFFYFPAATMTEPAATQPPPLPACVTWTLTEAAALMGCSPHHYANLFRRGEVPGRQMGRRIVIPKLQLARYLAGEDWA